MTSPDMAVSRELQVIAQEISDRLEQVAGERMGFSLLVFNAVDGSRMNYVSNCNRKDVHAALASLLKKWEEGMPDVPGHEVM